MIYFTRYHPDKPMTMLNLFYDELIGKIEEYEGKNHLMVGDYTLDKVLDKIKRIGLKKLNNIRILIDTDDKLPDDVTLMTCVIKNNDKFYLELSLEEVLYD